MNETWDGNVVGQNETGSWIENEKGNGDSDYLYDRTDVRAICIIFYSIVFIACFFGIFPQFEPYKSVADIQRQLKEHREIRSKYDGAGKRIYKSVDEVIADIKRPYHPNIGFYEPLNPRPSLTDPRCTRQGKLGCGDRCFIPATYTRCLNGQVIGPELSIPDFK